MSRRSPTAFVLRTAFDAGLHADTHARHAGLLLALLPAPLLSDVVRRLELEVDDVRPGCS